LSAFFAEFALFCFRYERVKDPELRRFASEINGALMTLSAERAKFHDSKCVDTFREGGIIVGKLARTGNGKAHDEPPKKSVHELREQR
jgi:hypothetical protein